MTAEPSSKTTHGAINWGSKSASANNGSTAKDLEVGSIGPPAKRICISFNRSSKGWHYLEPHTRLWCPLQLERKPPTTFAEQQRETGVAKRSSERVRPAAALHELGSGSRDQAPIPHPSSRTHAGRSTPESER
ncbi:hypothetical protein NCS52_01016400 [Fusarium sp. LHS14.1]|nr:hypothetical protein NCS52_01016400 [Fusarium sp. LHS14.1]